MKNFKALFFVFSIFLNLSYSFAAQDYNYRGNLELGDNPNLEILANELAKDTDFTDLSMVLFDMIQTYNLPVSTSKSSLTKEEREAQLMKFVDQKSTDQLRLSELIGYENKSQFSSLQKIGDQAASNLKQKFGTKFSLLSDEDQIKVYEMATEIAVNQNYFEESAVKINNTKASCKTCQNNFTRCGTPFWKRAILAACVAAGAGAATGVAVFSAGTLAAAGIAAAIAFAAWCAEELAVGGRGCNRSFENCIRSCN